MRKLLKKQGFAPEVLVTDKLRSYGAAKSEIGLSARHDQGLGANNRAENSQSADTTARAQVAAFQIARIRLALLVHSRRRPKHFQRPALSHIPPHAPRLPRRSFPDVASCYRSLNLSWDFQSSRGPNLVRATTPRREMAKDQQSRGAGEASVSSSPIVVGRREARGRGREFFRPQRRPASPQGRNRLGGIPPAHLPGWLFARALAYRLQAVAFGDLDRAILRRLREIKGEALDSEQARPFATRGPTTRKGVGLKSGGSRRARMERPYRVGHGPRLGVRLEWRLLPLPFAGS